MTELALPKIDKDTISRKNQIVSQLKKFTKDENILSENEEIKPYETDGLAAYKQTPLAVVLPENTKEVSEILKFCNQENIKVIPCLLYTSPSPRDRTRSRMPSSA